MAKKPRKTPKPKPLGAATQGPPVRVRMYRQGLGDCFLLTFGTGAAARHMLIDCGTLGATTTGITLAQVVKDIAATTGNHLHLLVATHEHQDHVKAFGQLAAEFKAMTIDHKWVAWTENPEDQTAKNLKKYANDLGMAVAAAVRAAPANSHTAARARDLLGFAGDVPAPGSGPILGADFAKTVHASMELVRTGFGSEAEYRTPEKPPLEPDFIPGFRFYVLGPPRDEAAIRDTGEHGSSELYGIAAGLRAAANRAAREASGGGAGTNDEQAAEEAEMPFDSRWRECGADVSRGWYREYWRESEEWRRIDESWLDSASDLALQLDSFTNNTSLALAIERIADGRVLLFPADAQQGNWLSWHGPTMKWSVKGPDGVTREVTAADLLKRTVFYKVGHHASHNATASGNGLELMTREEELTAFIPVDRAVALNKGDPGSWKMPARALYRRLLERCRGRVARSDIGWAVDAGTNATEKEFSQMATPAEWAAWKAEQQKASVTIEPMFVEYTLA